MTDSNFTWMNAEQIGAPQMNGASNSNGQLLQVLDACLVDGFNSKTVVSISKTSTTVTLGYGVTHGYVMGQLVEVSGANDATLNGKHKIIASTIDTITISASGVSQTTGVINTKVAPLGFESIFGSADPLKRAYRSKTVSTTRTVIYLDMTLPAGHGYNSTNPVKRATISLCEDMQSLGVQINSYTDAKNNFASNPNGSLFWYQCRNRRKTDAVSTSINSKWVIAGNSEYFYLFHEWQDYKSRGTDLRDIYAFGDTNSLSGFNDLNNCLCVCAVNSNDASDLFHASTGSTIKGSTSTPVGVFIKDVNGLNLADLAITLSGANSENVISGSVSGLTFPNPITGKITCLPIYAKTGQSLRSRLDNLMFVSHTVPASKNTGLVVSDDAVLVKMHQGNSTTDTDIGAFAIRIGSY